MTTTPAAPSLNAAEAAALEWVLGPYVDTVAQRSTVAGQRQRAQRWRLLPALHAVNDRVGWVSPAAIDAIGLRLGIGAAEVHAVASFYDLLSLTEQPAEQLRFCVDVVCRASGSRPPAEHAAGISASSCLGLCDHAPAVLATSAGEHPRLVPARMEDLSSAAHTAQVIDAARHLRTHHNGDNPDCMLLPPAHEDPTDLDAYLDRGGFSGLGHALALGPEAVTSALDASGLMGRGGAGFPTARKWDAVRQRSGGPKYVVCNADESEPGTFKDRLLLERNPFAVIESILIAMHTVGAQTGYIYLRGEYGTARTTLTTALGRAHNDDRTAELFAGRELIVFRGAGAYICGEETAIFSSIEGYRGEPRTKPPYPTEVGLFGQPTVVNNVETLVNVAPIVAAAARGTTVAANRRLLCVSGAVQRPGVYEVELGLTLGAVIELAGGVTAGSELQAVLLGGAAGAFVAGHRTDLILEHHTLRAEGLTLGSGAVVVYDHTVDLADQVSQIAAFFRHESCGQCVPCRVGTVRQHEVIQRLKAGSGDTDADLALLNEIHRAMTDASICGLGQTAGQAISVAVNVLNVFGPGSES